MSHVEVLIGIALDHNGRTMCLISVRNAVLLVYAGICSHCQQRHKVYRKGVFDGFNLKV